MKIIPTILCGGSGTRLWPTSRTYAPKQLQSLVGEKSLLANTVLRLQAQRNCISPVLICGQSYATEIEHQMEDEGAELSAVIAEPMGRDTAAAAAIAAHKRPPSARLTHSLCGSRLDRAGQKWAAFDEKQFVQQVQSVGPTNTQNFLGSFVGSLHRSSDLSVQASRRPPGGP